MGKKNKGGSEWEPSYPGVTIFELNTHIDGDIHSTENIRINGNITGNCKTDGVIIISKSGFVQGNLTGKSVIIKGTVKGDVHSKGQISLSCDSNVEGDCICKSIVIETGAFLNGRVAREEQKKSAFSKINPDKELSESVITETNDIQLNKDDQDMLEEDNTSRLW